MADSVKKQKIMKMYSELGDDRKEFVERLVDRMLWMEKTLNKLQRTINKEGPTLVTKNGNGFTTLQENPAQKSYNTMIRNYTSVIRQLNNMLDENSRGIVTDEFTEFLKG